MKTTKPNVKFRVRFDKEWDEYQVQVRINGKLNEAKTYHTDDQDDAISTKHAMQKELQEHPERYQEPIDKATYITVTETSRIAVNVGYVIFGQRKYPDPESTEVVIGVKGNLSEYVTWLRIRGNEYYHGHYFRNLVDAVKDFQIRA